jgi:hypothetical protein
MAGDLFAVRIMEGRELWAKLEYNVIDFHGTEFSVFWECIYGWYDRISISVNTM